MNIVEEQFPQDAHSKGQMQPRLATTEDEVRWLAWKARNTDGNILEIGTHYGLTTRILAWECPEKTVFTVDLISNESEMTPEQRHEMPTFRTVGMWARGMPNVFFTLQDSKTFNYAKKNIGFVFIDGDHTYKGVRADTELALAYNRCGHPLTIVWHDYYDHPWVRVKQYLAELAAAGLPIKHVSGTAIAYVDLP